MAADASFPYAPPVQVRDAQTGAVLGLYPLAEALPLLWTVPGITLDLPEVHHAG